MSQLISSGDGVTLVYEYPASVGMLVVTSICARYVLVKRPLINLSPLADVRQTRAYRCTLCLALCSIRIISCSYS